MNRIVLGGVLAGIVVFIWGAFSHMVLPIGEAGFETLANDEPVISALRGSITESGMYFFPGMDMSGSATPAETAAWEAKLLTGPSGLIIYTAGGMAPMSPMQLVTELMTGILAAILAGAIIVRIAGTTWQRAILVGVMGLFAALSISASHWNWYHFPTAFFVAEGIDQVVGWTLGGWVLAKVVKAEVG